MVFELVDVAPMALLAHRDVEGGSVAVVFYRFAGGGEDFGIVVGDGEVAEFEGRRSAEGF